MPKCFTSIFAIALVSSVCLGVTGQTVNDEILNSCTTSVVRGLGTQLMNEIECIEPGRMDRIDNIPRVSLADMSVFEYLQKPARSALAQAVASTSSTLTINSALRTLPQQFLLYQWYQNSRCGISLAAKPGKSKHESGLAIDIADTTQWKGTLESYQYQWLGASDPVHYTYIGSDTADLSSLSVKAFQRLWNKNNPDDAITEDGLYGPNTEARLKKSPSKGFDIGMTCGDEPEVDSAVSMHSIHLGLTYVVVLFATTLQLYVFF